jgi:hypothetical protein
MRRTREVRPCPESFKRPSAKENRNETQDQNQGGKTISKPQPHRSLTLLGMYRSLRSEVMPETFKRPKPKKENRMKLKTKIKAGKLASNHNPIVR